MNCLHPDHPESWIDEVISIAKTGDLILFKALDNLNSSKIFSYYTHIGIVYVKPDTNQKMIFEANSPNGLEIYDYENKNGIYFSDLHVRLSRYRGYTYFKQLNKPVNKENENSFQEFINYAVKNMHYENNVIWNGLKKKIGVEILHEGTNCGEIILLSLIKLGIIDENHFKTRALHHLYWMCNVKECDFGYIYPSIFKIKISPFS